MPVPLASKVWPFFVVQSLLSQHPWTAYLVIGLCNPADGFSVRQSAPMRADPTASAVVLTMPARVRWVIGLRVDRLVYPSWMLGNGAKSLTSLQTMAFLKGKRALKLGLVPSDDTNLVTSEDSPANDFQKITGNDRPAVWVGLPLWDKDIVRRATQLGDQKASEDASQREEKQAEMTEEQRKEWRAERLKALYVPIIVNAKALHEHDLEYKRAEDPAATCLSCTSSVDFDNLVYKCKECSVMCCTDCVRRAKITDLTAKERPEYAANVRGEPWAEDGKDSALVGVSGYSQPLLGNILHVVNHEHKLTKTKNPYAGHGSSSYQCNECYRSRVGQSYHCATCQFDLCMSCIQNFVRSDAEGASDLEKRDSRIAEETVRLALAEGLRVYLSPTQVRAPILPSFLLFFRACADLPHPSMLC